MNKIIPLPEPKLTGSASLEELLANRRSIRQFTNKALDNTQIAQLVWAGQGITDKNSGKRTAPSAGALYPLQLYIATAEGLFIYYPSKHALKQIDYIDLRKDLSVAAFGQAAISCAPCVIIITGIADILAVKYGDRANRYMLLEAGHAAQNILLQATAMQLGAVPIGAFSDEKVHKICRMPKNTEPLYIIPIGHPEQPQ